MSAPRPATERHPNGVLDTSTVILLKRVDPDSLPASPLITTVTLAELSVGPHLAETDEDRAIRQAHLQQAEHDFEALPFDAPAARAFGQVSAALRSTGRKPSARAFDALIAAIALSEDLPVYTANPRDFEGIPGLTVHTVDWR